MRQFKSDVVVERVGNDVLILCQATGQAHRLDSEFSDTVDALLTGKDASPFQQQISTLDELGLLQAESRGTPSRRQAVAGFAGLIGAGAATLALPSAAFAASPSFFVNNSTFQWADGDADGNPGFEVGDVVALDTAIFPVGSSWTITVDTRSGIRTATETVRTDGAGGTSLIFNFTGGPLATGTGLILLGSLSGRGLTSNRFQVSEFIPGAP